MLPCRTPTVPARKLIAQSPGVAQRASEQELDLAVDAAQLVGCPALDGVEGLRVQAQQERLAIRHRAGATYA